MKIGEVGDTFQNTIKVDYHSDQTFLEYDMLILNFGFILKNFNVNIIQLLERRRSDLKEFIDHKKTPIVVIVPLIGHNDILQGPGRPSLSSLLPVGPFDITNESGRSFSIQPNTPFSVFFETYKSQFKYSSYFTAYDGTPTLTTPLSNKVLSFYNNDVVFIPEIVISDLSMHTQIPQGLYNIVTSINKKDPLSLPQWTSGYRLPGETVLLAELDTLRAEMAKINDQITDRQSKLEGVTTKKALFTESGTSLEDSVEDILKEMGLEILESTPSRDDLIVKYKDQIAVIEIKGVTGTSAEKHSAQLEKWVANYYENHDIKAKGILLINSHREHPLSERSDMTFPHQMLKYASQREHCLLTTLQLLGLYFDIKADETKKEQLLDELFSTIGIYSKYKDWTDFITTSI